MIAGLNFFRIPKGVRVKGYCTYCHEWVDSDDKTHECIAMKTAKTEKQIYGQKCLSGEHEAEILPIHPTMNVSDVKCDQCGIDGQYHSGLGEYRAATPHSFVLYKLGKSGDPVCKHCRCLYVER